MLDGYYSERDMLYYHLKDICVKGWNYMLNFILRHIKTMYYIVIIILVIFLVKYMYDQFTGEIVTEDFVIEEKKVLPVSSRRPDNQYVIIAEDKEFKIDKEDYDNIEIGDRVYVNYNVKTLFVNEVLNVRNLD